MSEYIQRQIEERQKAWHSAKEILDRAASEKRDLSSEERESYDRTMADLDSRAEVIKTMRADEERAREIEAAAAAAPEVRTEARPVTTDEDRLRSFLQGDQRSITFAPERRDVTKASTGAPVPTSFYNSVMEKFRYTGPMLNPDVVSIWNTTSGENLQVPVQNARPTGTLTAEADPFAESDPTFSAFITLGAYKYGFLTQMSRELIEDNGVNILDYLSGVTANTLGYDVNTVLTTGTGSSQPKGIVAAAGSGITGSTAVSGAFTYANLMNLTYSLDAAARRVPSFGFMANATSIAAMRTLTDPASHYVFAPALDAATPDRILGYPLIENPAVASPATSAKSVIAGDLKSYIVRQVNGIRLDRSDEYGFANDLVTFRATIRVDGNNPQSTHIKYFAGAAS